MVVIVGQVDSLEHAEPHDVHAHEHREKQRAQVNERLELGVLNRIRAGRKLVDHHGEAKESEINPHELAEQERIDCVGLINRSVKGLSYLDRDVSQIVDHDDQSSDLLQVTENKSKVKRDSQNVM